MVLTVPYTSSAEKTDLPALNEEYQKIWSRSKDTIDVDHLESLANKFLRFSDNWQPGQPYLAELQERTGMRFSPPLKAGMDERVRLFRRYARWRFYLGRLEAAVEEKIPLILHGPDKPKRTYLTMWQEREAAVGHLGAAPHPAFLPLLRALVANEDEPNYLRRRALLSISQTPHEGAIPYLIAHLTADEDWIVKTARIQLGSLTGNSFHVKNASALQRKYEAWWRKHQDDFVYDEEARMRAKTLY